MSRPNSVHPPAAAAKKPVTASAAAQKKSKRRIFTEQQLLNIGMEKNQGHYRYTKILERYGCGPGTAVYENIIEQCFIKMAKSYKYLSFTVNEMTRESTYRVSTAAVMFTGDHFKLLLNPEFFVFLGLKPVKMRNYAGASTKEQRIATFSIDQAIEYGCTVLVHECGHFIMQHIQRSMTIKKDLLEYFMMGCELAVNSLFLDVTKLPSWAVSPHRFFIGDPKDKKLSMRQFPMSMTADAYAALLQKKDSYIRDSDGKHTPTREWVERRRSRQNRIDDIVKSILDNIKAAERNQHQQEEEKKKPGDKSSETSEHKKPSDKGEKVEDENGEQDDEATNGGDDGGEEDGEGTGDDGGDDAGGESDSNDPGNGEGGGQDGAGDGSADSRGSDGSASGNGNGSADASGGSSGPGQQPAGNGPGGGGNIDDDLFSEQGDLLPPGAGDETDIIDDHDVWNERKKLGNDDSSFGDLDDIEVIQAVMNDVARRIMRRADSKAQQAGCLPGNYKEYIDALLRTNDVPFGRLVQGVIARAKASVRKRTFMRPSRRMPIPPGHRRGQRVFAKFWVDTSGSVCDADLVHMLSEAVAAETRGHAEVEIQMFDHGLQGPPISAKKFKAKPMVQGRGGTDLNHVFKDIEQSKPDIAFIQTDGYVEIPLVKPKVKLVWIITSGGRMPDRHGDIVIKLPAVPGRKATIGSGRK